MLVISRNHEDDPGACRIVCTDCRHPLTKPRFDTSTFGQAMLHAEAQGFEVRRKHRAGNHHYTLVVHLCEACLAKEAK